MTSSQWQPIETNNGAADLIPAGSEIEVTFRIKLPVTATEEHMHEWLRFELGDNGSIRHENVLLNEPVEPIFGTFDWQVRRLPTPSPLATDTSSKVSTNGNG